MNEKGILTIPQNGNFDYILATKQIQIFNSLGESIQTKKIEGQSSQNFQLIDNGIYHIQITTDIQIITQKLIVCR